LSSKPFFPFKVNDHQQSDSNEYDPNKEISQTPLDLGHEFKIHTVNSGDKCQRDEYGSYNSQNLHDFVHAIAGNSEICVVKSG
jgi:hypothetical protein